MITDCFFDELSVFAVATLTVFVKIDSERHYDNIDILTEAVNDQITQYCGDVIRNSIISHSCYTVLSLLNVLSSTNAVLVMSNRNQQPT